MTQGTILQLWRAHADRAGSLPDAGHCMGVVFDVQIVSSRVKRLLDRLGLSDELEYEQYPVYTSDGKTFIRNYYCVRYLVHLDCADEQRSYFHCEPPFRVGGRLVLRRQAISDHRMFLVKNYRFDVEVVRSDVKEAIERAGFTGFYFKELEVV